MKAFYAYVQKVLEREAEGKSKLAAAISSGEKLFVSTNPEGREVIRKELRLLRDQWDRALERMGNIHRQTDRAVQQWTIYREKREGLICWIEDTEEELLQLESSCNSLQEKKEKLLKLKVTGCLKFSRCISF